MNGNGWMKSMLSVNLDYVEGVVDVSIIVPTCFENPLKKLATDFLGEVLSLRRKAIIPVTAVLGAYHIATRYLRAPRRVVKKILVEMLETRFAGALSSSIGINGCGGVRCGYNL